MFISFSPKKCPVCGTTGKQYEKELMRCPNCMTIYSEFMVVNQPKDTEDKLN